MLRIGIWFDETHCSYGGPMLVLIGTVIGLIRDAQTSCKPVIILINEQGDVNWVLNRIPNYEKLLDYIRNPVIGPFFNIDDLNQQDNVWNRGKQIVASDWVKQFIQKQIKVPRLGVWEAGVDIDFFNDNKQVKTQDYFIYFKSQNYTHLHALNTYLFHNYFKMTGTILTYYFYSPYMLREHAQKSKFCIFMSGTETQGLAFLEILACNIPVFVIDKTNYKNSKIEFNNATSATCFSNECGMKSSPENVSHNFPIFLQNLQTYTPRDFVLKHFSFEKSANALKNLLCN